MTQTILSTVVLLAHVLAIFTLLLAERRQPSATLAWIFAIIFLPVLGLVLYMLFGATRIKRIARRSAKAAQRLQQVLDSHDVQLRLAGHGKPLDPRTESFLRLGKRVSSTPASHGNHSEILVNAAATYRAMIAAIESAQDHIHLQFYIIRPDDTGIALQDRLVRRAQAGVQVRVMYDGVGSLHLPHRFWDPLRQAGGKVAVFNPVIRAFRIFRKRDRIDFRNHRKILVVDGQVGFTGGINIGREYLGLDPEMGRWRDTHVRIHGPAVLGLQKAFCEDWLTTSEELLDDPRYFPDIPAPEDGNDIIQIVDSGPDRSWSPISHFFSHGIALAQKRVWITSPYFIPAPSIEQALLCAALRGVDVRLLLPAHPDHLLVSLAAKTYHTMLLEAGVRIFEYERGFVHAKTMVLDDWVGTVGSANMDMRSFNLNFEINAFIFGAEFVSQLAGQFTHDLGHAREVARKPDTLANYPKRLLCAAARLLSPLL